MLKSNTFFGGPLHVLCYSVTDKSPWALLYNVLDITHVPWTSSRLQPDVAHVQMIDKDKPSLTRISHTCSYHELTY